MRKLLLILIVLTFSLSSCGQDFREYSFLDIGLHINVPANYDVQNHFPRSSFLDANGKKITDTTKLHELEADLMKVLLVVSSPDRNNTASINFAIQTAKTGDFESYYNFSKDMQQFMSKQQMGKYDTASSVLAADNIIVHKFMTFTTDTNPVKYSEIYFTQLRKYFLVIKADYTEKKFGEDIEKSILSAKFD